MDRVLQIFSFFSYFLDTVPILFKEILFTQSLPSKNYNCYIVREHGVFWKEGSWIDCKQSLPFKHSSLLSTLYFLLYLILETHFSPFIQVCVFFIYHRDPQRYFLLRWNLMLVGNTCNLLYHKSHSHGNLAHTHIQTEGFSDSIPSRILTLYRILMEEIHSSYQQVAMFFNDWRPFLQSFKYGASNNYQIYILLKDIICKNGQYRKRKQLSSSNRSKLYRLYLQPCCN